MLQRYALGTFTLLAALLTAERMAAQGDTCTTALQVISGVYASTGPTSGYAGPACGSGTNGNWYVYTATFNGAITITSCHPLNTGLQFDTYLKVYTGDCDNLVCVAYNDDMGGSNCPTNAFASYLQVNVTAGQDYFIVWTNTFSSLPFSWELNECAGTAVGQTYYDNNDNGTREPGEAHAPVMLLVQPGDHYVYSGNDPYSFCTDLGGHTITVPNPPLYHNAVPASQTFTIAQQGDQATGMDFGFQGIPGIYDGACDIWGWNPWIGNNTTLHLSYRNLGTEDIDATLTLTLDPLLSYVSATTTADDVTGQVVTWDLGVLTPGQQGVIHVTILCSAAAQPNAPVGNSVQLTIAETDVNPDDNFDHLAGICTTSFDPNEKLVSTETISMEDVADQKRLEYTVHFQNEGNAPAVNIVVKDSLDADWDLSTFEMIGTTHPFTLTVNNQVAIWTFANIMLPTMDSDELGSQGGFHYRVAAKNNLLPGDELTNRADIYFDYNVPVLTNTTVTTVELNTGLAGLSNGHGLSISPSPSTGVVNIRWSSIGSTSGRLSITDVMGRTVHQSSIALSNGQSFMDLSTLPEGSYMARLSTNDSESWTRFVIQR